MQAARAMLFPRFDIPGRYRPMAGAGSGALAEGELSVRWLGTAGYCLRYGGTSLLLDPFLSRPGLLSVALRPLQPDTKAIERHLDGADFVACGHSHYDHVLDVPAIALRFGAIVLGSASTCTLALAAGVPRERLRVVPPEGAVHRCGPFCVRFVPSLHGRIFAGRVPLPGEIGPGLRLPARAWAYRMGGAYGLLIEAGPHRLYHNGSADLVDAELDGARADVVLVGLAGRQATPRYLARLTGALGPGVLVPTHYDAFFAPLEQGLRLLPRVDMQGFFEEAAAVAPQARLLLPYPLEELRLRPGAAPVLVGKE
jgi:L-ascorbate metabolism protein UlaG (beta-lactamase superfamily)